MGIWQSVCSGVRCEGRREGHHSSLHSSLCPCLPSPPHLRLDGAPSSGLPQPLGSSGLVPLTPWTCPCFSPLRGQELLTYLWCLPRDQHGRGAQSHLKMEPRRQRWGGLCPGKTAWLSAAIPGEAADGLPELQPEDSSHPPERQAPATWMFLLPSHLTEQTHNQVQRAEGEL